MFSTMPRIGTFTLLNIAMPLRTTPSDASCGVVTMTPPSSGTVWQSESCASPVPGGKSTSRKSRSPHSTAIKNWSIVFAIIGPRQITGWSSVSSKSDAHHFHAVRDGRNEA